MLLGPAGQDCRNTEYEAHLAHVKAACKGGIQDRQEAEVHHTRTHIPRDGCGSVRTKLACTRVHKHDSRSVVGSEAAGCAFRAACGDIDGI